MKVSNVNIYILNATVLGKMMTEILCQNTKIKGLITLDQTGKEKTAEYYDYTSFCEVNGLECVKLETYNLSSEADKNRVLAMDIDLLIVAGWQRLIPRWLIDKCTIGAIGFHGSSEGIEKGRGRSPQNWAIMTGQKKFILSAFWIEAEADNGAILDTCEFSYDSLDTILSSYVKTSLYEADMILKNISNGRIMRKEGMPQSNEAFYLPQRTAEDGMIDWNRDARDIDNMVKALTKPYPGAYTVCNGEVVKIWISRPITTEQDYFYEQYENGTVVTILGESFLVKCGKNLLLVDGCSNFDAVNEGGILESADYQEQIKQIIARHDKKVGTPLSHLITDELRDE